MVTGGVLALIPARGGSKSVPRKNLRPLGGVPLIAYSIEAALTASGVDRVLVSTDDPEIASVARRAGADVPFLRPHALALDDTLDLPVFRHALDWLEEHKRWRPDLVVHLRPTSPLRPPGLVDEGLARLRSSGEADSVRAVVPASQNPFKMWRLEPDGTVAPLLDGGIHEAYNQPRQALPAVFWQSGHLDVVRAAALIGRGTMSGARILPLMVDAAYACDIDSAADWERAEWMLARFAMPLVRPQTRDVRLPEHVAAVVFDFDGVMTDDRVWVTATGQEWVACHRGDGLGVERLRAAGVPILVLSKETDAVVAARCAKLRVECLQGVDDKAGALRAWLRARDIDPADIVYVGNDVNDLECLAMAGCGVAVSDAHPDVLAEADIVLAHRGGEGVVRDICDRVRRHITEARR